MMMATTKKVPAIRFKGFEESWDETQLGEIGGIIGGGTPSTSNKELWNGTIDWYSPTEIGDEVYANGSIKKITPLGLEQSSATILPANRTVLFTSRAGIGDMAILKSPGATNQGFQSLVLNEDCNTYFIYSMGFLIKKFALKYSSGSTFLEISGKTLGKMAITIPSPTEQTQIGNYFKELDSLIQLQEQKLKKVTNLKKVMLEKMFPKEGVDIPEVRFKEFTKKWGKKKLGEVGELLTGNAFESKKFIKSGILLVRGMNVKRGYLDVSEDISEYWPTSKGLENYLLEENDIVIQMDGALIGKSYAKISSENLPALLVQRVTRVRNSKVNSEFVYQKIQRDFLKHISGIKTETAVPHLSLNDVRNFEIDLPLKEEQQKIGEYFKNLDRFINQSQQKIEQLKHLKQALLKKMFI
jgi:type I restriction enzyme S subunit